MGKRQSEKVMTGNAPRSIFLKDYTAPPFLISAVELHFELGEDETRVRAITAFRRTHVHGMTQRAPLVLQGNGLTLHSLFLDGVALDASHYDATAQSLTVRDVPDAFVLDVVTVIKPQENTALEGLYKSSGNFCTQCEAEGFRRITYFLDRPDVMACYTTTIVAEKARYPVLLSNGNLIEHGEMPDGRHWAKWEDPFPKPSYLFALVAGSLLHKEDNFVTRSGRNVVLRLYVESVNIDKCEHALNSLKRAMRWDEDVFGCEYDLDIYMIVAVNDFNMGAMENKGLNVFNSACVLAKPETATDGDYESIEAIVGHEYFHNWTGNRVTCRDWFQLSLKEGLTVFRDQEFTSDMMSRAVKRIADVNVLRTSQFPQDASPLAHAVRPDSYIDISNFYTVTVYNKGAEVVGMLRTLLGNDGFRKGMDLYFERHDGEAVTTDDFVKAMEDANGRDFAQFRLWYTQSGTPEIDVGRYYDAAKREYTLTVRQHCPATPGQPTKEPFHIPFSVALLDREGAALPLHIKGELGSDRSSSRVLELRTPTTKICFSDISSEPTPSLLRGFSAPVKVNVDYTDDELMFLMAHDHDDFNRWEAGQRLATRVINRLIADFQDGLPLQMPEGFVDAFCDVLENRLLDKALVAQAIVLPNETYLAEMQEVVDPLAIHTAREFICNGLAKALEPVFWDIYHANIDLGPYQFNAKAAGARALKNVCLNYLVRLETDDVRQLAMNQLDNSNNMTDVLAALNALVNVDVPERSRALDAFYQRWSHDPLVVDKWFSLQGRCSLVRTLSDVQALVQHTAFQIKNPNKVRAVIGGFAFGNPVRFHDLSGQGYRFVADHIIQLNALNPQVAARMANAFTQWRRFDEPRQVKMLAELRRIESTPGLALDVYEIVSKTLGG